MTQPGDVRVRRALLSVSDKTGIAEFARGLAELDIELVSTGGTAATDAAEVRDALRPLEHDLLCEAVALIGRGAVSFDPGHPRRVLVAP